MSLIKTALQCLYPTLCRSCEQLIPAEDIFCAACLADLKSIPSIVLPIGSRLTMKVFAVSPYQLPVKPLVTKKFSGDVLASQQLARLMLSLTPIRKQTVDFLIPIPLHWTRYARRGFNQSYEMAKVLSSDLQAPTVRLLSRTRMTTFQWKLSGARRQENVKDAFSIHPWYRYADTEFLADKHIVLVDDLCTTGATLVHAAKIIARVKPASITALVGCRAV